MATRQYENPWASGIKSLTGAYVAKQQGLAEQAAAQQAAQLEAEQWAREFDLQQQRTLSQLARDQAGIKLDKQEYGFNERHNPLLMDQTQAQTASSRASAAASRASARGQNLQNTAYETNLGLTGGRSTEVYSPGQAEVANAEQITRLSALAKELQAERSQLPDDSPQAAQLDQTLNVLRNQVGQAQQVYDMTSSLSPGQVAATRARNALAALEEAGGDMSALTPIQQRDIEAFYASQPQTDAGVTALSDSQQGASVSELGDTYNAALNLMDVGTAALGTIEAQGDKIVGLPAGLIRLTDSVRGAVTGISDLTGLIDADSARYVADLTSGLTENAGDAKTLQALLTDFAIMNYRLKNPSDPRMSDFDLRTQLKPVEGGSARSIAAFLEASLARVPQYYDNAVRTRQALGITVPEGLQSLGVDTRQPQPAPPETAPQGQGGFQLAPEDAALLNKYLN